MRKLILGFYVSLDGKSADGDNGIRDVMMSIDDPEQEEYFVKRLWEAGAFLMGRNTYEIMAGYWPDSDHPSARAMNEIPKVVFSRTLKSADEWPETRGRLRRSSYRPDERGSRSGQSAEAHCLGRAVRGQPVGRPRGAHQAVRTGPGRRPAAAWIQGAAADAGGPRGPHERARAP
ncbi:dihydrofolate reductase family protein [Actinomadura madurae]|nr:dihydrofolate reductase family protein [Actinomadura madurae]URM97248.1 dihydrofolate reductase family protein [Actinomadura madurae]